MDTLLLDADTWDLVLDSAGNMAVASSPYALAQDAASAVKLFQGELWYDTTQGVPYWQQVLGKLPPLTLVRAKLESAALTVPTVQSATCFFASFDLRRLAGQVQVTDVAGRVAVAGF